MRRSIVSEACGGGGRAVGRTLLLREMMGGVVAMWLDKSISTLAFLHIRPRVATDLGL